MWSLCFNVYQLSLMNWNRNGRQRHCGRQSWSCFGKSLAEALCSSSLVCIDSVTYLSIPLTIRTPRGCVVLKQRFDQNFNTVSIFMATNFYVQDWTDSRILENPSFRSSELFASKHCVFSAETLHPISFFCIKSIVIFSTIFKPDSEHSLGNFWSSDILFEFALTILHHFSLSLLSVWGSAIEGSVRISIVSKYSGAWSPGISGWFLAQIYYLLRGHWADLQKLSCGEATRRFLRYRWSE